MQRCCAQGLGKKSMSKTAVSAAIKIRRTRRRICMDEPMSASTIHEQIQVYSSRAGQATDAMQRAATSRTYC